jgi:hypothetical protein
LLSFGELIKGKARKNIIVEFLLEARLALKASDTPMLYLTFTSIPLPPRFFDKE